MAVFSTVESINTTIDNETQSEEMVHLSDSNNNTDNIEEEDKVIETPNNNRDIIFKWLDDPTTSTNSLIFALFILGVILISTVTFIIESSPQFHCTISTDPGCKPIFGTLETIFIIIFTIEYALRIITCRRRLSYALEILNIVDFVAIAPFYIELLVKLFVGDADLGSFAILRVIRLARVFRIFKVSKYSGGFTLVISAMGRSKDAFVLLFVLMSIAAVVFASLEYFAETADCTWDAVNEQYIRNDDGLPTDFQSITATLWWSMTTMTTVGYGDTYPHTRAGKIIASLTMLVGIISLALPVSVIGTNFQEIYKEEKRAKDQARLNKIRTQARMAAAIKLKEEEDIMDEIRDDIRDLKKEKADKISVQTDSRSATPGIEEEDSMNEFANSFLKQQGAIMMTLASDLSDNLNETKELLAEAFEQQQLLFEMIEALNIAKGISSSKRNTSKEIRQSKIRLQALQKAFPTIESLELSGQ